MVEKVCQYNLLGELQSVVTTKGREGNLSFALLQEERGLSLTGLDGKGRRLCQRPLPTLEKYELWRWRQIGFQIVWEIGGIDASRPEEKERMTTIINRDVREVVVHIEGAERRAQNLPFEDSLVGRSGEAAFKRDFPLRR